MPGVTRRAIRDTELLGFRIPAGTYIVGAPLGRPPPARAVARPRRGSTRSASPSTAARTRCTATPTCRSATACTSASACTSAAWRSRPRCTSCCSATGSASRPATRCRSTGSRSPAPRTACPSPSSGWTGNACRMSDPALPCRQDDHHVRREPGHRAGDRGPGRAGRRERRHRRQDDRAGPAAAGTIHTAAAEIEAAGGAALPILGDVRDENSVAAAVAADRRALRRDRHRGQQRFGDQPEPDRRTAAEALRPDDGHQRPRHVRADEPRAAAPGEGGEPARAHALAAAEHGPQMARACTRRTPSASTR